MSVKKNTRTGAYEVRWRQSGRQRSRSFRNEKAARKHDAYIADLDEAGLLAGLVVEKDQAAGDWLVRWDDHRGDPRQRSFPVKEDALTFETKLIERRRLGRPTDRVDVGVQTVAEFVTNVWVPEHIEARDLAITTRQNYADAWRVHLTDTFGSMPLRDITAPRIRRWQADRLAAGAGKRAINNAMMILGSILQTACKAEELQSNPVRIVDPVPLEAKKETRPLPALTVERVRAHALDHFDATLIAVLGYSGVRPQEAWGLRWADVRDRTLHIHQATDSVGGTKPTKTKSARTVRLLAPLAQDLAEWRLASGRPDDDALIFPSPDTGQVATRNDQGSWRRRRWAGAWKAAAAVWPEMGPVVRPYDLRHSFASLLLAEGRSIHYTAKQLGHNPALTLSTYGHAIDEYEDDDLVRVNPEAKIREARAEVAARCATSVELASAEGATA